MAFKLICSDMAFKLPLQPPLNFTFDILSPSISNVILFGHTPIGLYSYIIYTPFYSGLAVSPPGISSLCSVTPPTIIIQVNENKIVALHQLQHHENHFLQVLSHPL